MSLLDEKIAYQQKMNRRSIQRSLETLVQDFQRVVTEIQAETYSLNGVSLLEGGLQQQLAQLAAKVREEIALKQMVLLLQEED